ncbi:hypothetical protein Tco_0174466 [Tanacetum coccineum]
MEESKEEESNRKRKLGTRKKDEARKEESYKKLLEEEKKKYPLRKKVLFANVELKLESEEDSTMALELIRFVKKLLA